MENGWLKGEIILNVYFGVKITTIGDNELKTADRIMKGRAAVSVLNGIL